MAGTISFAGIGSNIDVNGIIDALVKADSANQTVMQQKVTELNRASSNVSGISSALSSLTNSLSSLTDGQTIQSYVATSSGPEVATSLIGAPQAGKYSVNVLSTAKEYRSYSTTLGASQGDAANISGILHIAVGDSASADVSIAGTDSISDIVNRINQSGLRVAASTVFDGSSYRIQLRGLDSGKANQVSLSGLDLGFSDPENLVQQASDAHVQIDKIDVYSSTNQITGVIPGVTLGISAETTSPVNVEVKTDPQGLINKIQSVISAYNTVIGKVHSLAGYGTVAAADPSLAGDATLRGLTDRMSDAVLTQVDTGTNYNNLSTIGISIQRDGTLSLDTTKLQNALTKDPTSVTAVLAGPANGQGVMDIMHNLADSYGRSGDGLLANKQTSLDDNAKSWTLRLQQEQDRLTQYTDLLQKQFQAMNTTVSADTQTMNYLMQLYGGTGSAGGTGGTSSTGK